MARTLKTQLFLPLIVLPSLASMACGSSAGTAGNGLRGDGNSASFDGGDGDTGLGGDSGLGNGLGDGTGSGGAGNGSGGDGAVSGGDGAGANGSGTGGDGAGSGGTSGELPDQDGDGVPDEVEQPGGMDQDSDGDTIPDHLDADDDGDGVPTIDELGDDPNEPRDSDGDGVPDFRDDDDDGDGIPTVDELGDDPETPADSDDDDVPDYIDGDDDGDGVPTIDEWGDDPESPENSDDDDIPDYLDGDDDGDGVPTIDEIGDPEDPADSDDDNTPDYLDGDDDGDGVPTIDELGEDPEDPQDTDGDTVPDYVDGDDDGDGLLTSAELGDPENPADSDDDDTPDYIDDDDDNDGLLTSLEEPDNDGNGLPEDALNTDGDGVPNYLDPDDDGDGKSTTSERPGGMDQNTDGDSLPDHLDPNDNGTPHWDIDGVVTVSNAESSDSAIHPVSGQEDATMNRAGQWFTYNHQVTEGSYMAGDPQYQSPWPEFTCFENPTCEGLISTDAHFGTYSYQSSLTQAFDSYSGFGFDFNNPGISPASKLRYDISAFTGLSFYMKGAVSGGSVAHPNEDQVRVSIATYNSAGDHLGGNCVPDEGMGLYCNDHYGVFLDASPTWQRVMLNIDDTTNTLAREGWGQGTFDFEPQDALGLLWEFKGNNVVDNGQTYDLKIDDVYFRAPIDDFDATPDFRSVVERDNGVASLVWTGFVAAPLGGGENAASLNEGQTLSGIFNGGAAFDAGSYAGIRFSVPSTTNATIRVEMPTTETVATANFGMEVDTSSTDFQIFDDGTWKTFVVKFIQEDITGPFGTVDGIDGTLLIGVSFEVVSAAGAVQIDEIEFY